MTLDDRPVIALLTVCSARRAPVLANRTMFAAIVRAWRAADSWAVGRFVVMPDHVHLFCAPAREVSLSRWVQYWKALSARRWPTPPLWQRDFWDTQLRSFESYEEKWVYVRNNPVRHGLVTRAGEWPYAGELERLEWD